MKWPWHNCAKGRHAWVEEVGERTSPTGHVYKQLFLQCRHCPERVYQATISGAPPEAAAGRPPPASWRGRGRRKLLSIIRERRKKGQHGHG